MVRLCYNCMEKPVFRYTVHLNEELFHLYYGKTLLTDVWQLNVAWRELSQGGIKYVNIVHTIVICYWKKKVTGTRLYRTYSGSYLDVLCTVLTLIAAISHGGFMAVWQVRKSGGDITCNPLDSLWRSVVLSASQEEKRLMGKAKEKSGR